MPPRLHITGDDDEPDPLILRHLQEEGFDVTFLPHRNGGKEYKEKLKHLSDDLELGESYGIIGTFSYHNNAQLNVDTDISSVPAYGDAAADCLEHHIKPQPHLAALIAYYPTTIANPQTKYPSQLQVLCHVAGSQGFAPAFPSYTYQGAKPGFAENDLDEFNKIAASLAWTRTLGVLRKAFKTEASLEEVWEEHLGLKFATKDPAKTMATMVPEAYVNHVPTMTGGIGQKDLFLFYRDYFIPKIPPSLRMKLVSRTIGVDRVVDEMIISFKHTQEVPWMLPGVPATDKVVHVAVVSVVGVRGDKLTHEHVYWDQASVLVQIGLLDPKLVPGPMKQKGMKQLPVNGSETAAKVLDKESHLSNDLIPSWKDRPKGDPGVLPSRPKQAANGTQSDSVSKN